MTADRGRPGIRRFLLVPGVPPASTQAVAVAALAVPLAAFLLLGALQLHLPGLHYDEAKEAGLNAMQLLLGQPVTAFRDATVQIGDRHFPLMVQDYIGALNVLLALPFLSLGGIHVVALRWLPLLTGALTLVGAWRIAWHLGGPVAATVTALLLAVNPAAVFWSRQGIFVTNVTALILVFSLLTGLHWWQKHRPADLWLTAFLWGLGIYAKLLFVWAIVAMIVVAVSSRLISRGRASSSPSRRHALCVFLLAAVAFFVPLIPLVLFNLTTGGTFTSLLGNLGRSYYGVDNAAYFPNLAVRLQQLVHLLRGDFFWYLGEQFANPWAPWLAGGLVVVALLAGLVAASWQKAVPREPAVNSAASPNASPPVAVDAPEKRPSLLLGPAASLAAVVALLLLVVAQSAFTISDLFITHLVLLPPLIAVAGGLAVRVLWGLARVLSITRQPKALTRLSGLLAGAALVAVGWWAGADLWTTVRYHQVLAISGGVGSHSDAIERLATYLAAGSGMGGGQRTLSAPLALDWGLDAPVRFLTRGQVNPVEVFGYTGLNAPDAGFAERIGPFLANPDNLYIAHAPEQTVFRGRVEALIALAQAQGMALREEARFNERSGRPLFVVYRAIKSRQPAP